MRTFTLQDWTTIRGSSASSIVQSATDWLDAAAYADVVFWLEVSEVTNPGAGTLSIVYETSPTKDESLFQAIGTVTLVAGSTPTVTKVLMNASPFGALQRFVRWRIQPSTSGSWDTTFRLQASLGMGVGTFSPLQLPGLSLWLRADQGVVLSSGKVSGWADSSGAGNGASQFTTANQPTVTANAINGQPALNFAGTASMTGSTSVIPTAGSAYTVFAVAKQGSGALFTLRQSNTYSATMFTGTTTYVFGDGVNTAANVTIPNSSAITNSASTAFRSTHVYFGTGLMPYVYLNGVLQSTGPAGTHQTTESGTGGYVVCSDAANQVWGGLLAELIVCQGSLGTDWLSRVWAYQTALYGV